MKECSECGKPLIGEDEDSKGELCDQCFKEFIRIDEDGEELTSFN